MEGDLLRYKADAASIGTWARSLPGCKDKYRHDSEHVLRRRSSPQPRFIVDGVTRCQINLINFNSGEQKDRTKTKQKVSHTIPKRS